MRFFPSLHRTHPNYFYTVLAIVGTHVILGLAGIFGTHQALAWQWWGGEGIVRVLGFIHLFLAWLIVMGLYRKWSLVRHGELASVAFYFLTTCFSIAAVIGPPLQGRGFENAAESLGYNVAMALVAFAAYREPRNPGRYAAPDEE